MLSSLQKINDMQIRQHKNQINCWDELSYLIQLINIKY